MVDFDDFDIGPQSDEFYDDEEYRYGYDDETDYYEDEADYFDDWRDTLTDDDFND